MQKIVTIGGGTGHFQLLRGLKNYDCEISAVVSMSDNGGSTGKLMDEYGILPPGDIRQCLIALADNEKGRQLREIFNYRFKKGEGLNGHNLGNLILTALTDLYGDVGSFKEACKMLDVEGKVIPVTIDKVKLFGKLEGGEILEGQTEVSYPSSGKIENIFHDPKGYICKEAKEAILEADKIVICPGDLYGSILPNFVIDGVREALQESKAKKIYVCNLVTKQGNFNFKASDFVGEIEKYSGVEMDNIILNKSDISEEVKKKYLLEKSNIVEDDLIDDARVVRGNFVEVYPSESKTLLRHNPKNIAREIIGL